MTKLAKFYKIIAFYQDNYNYTKKDFYTYPCFDFLLYIWDKLEEGGELEIDLNKCLKIKIL